MGSRCGSVHEAQALVAAARGERVAELMASGPIGVLAYDGDAWWTTPVRRSTRRWRTSVLMQLELG